jgi:N-methylhydantoinase A/oxoprolinase/acetone carboxylase beta subunit
MYVLAVPNLARSAAFYGDVLGFDVRDIDRIVHGTTVVANALIERKGARTGLVATAGFGDVLEIGREVRYDIYDLAIAYPPPGSDD